MSALRAVAAPLALLATACSDPASRLPVIEAAPRNHQFSVVAEGEIVPSEAITIRLPDGVNMGFDIAWMVPEYSEVKQGDVLVRFNEGSVLSALEYSQLDVAGHDMHLAVQERQSALARLLIDHEALRVDEEQDIARTFVDVDPGLFSRHEILDALGDLDYLGVQDAYFAWQAETHEQRAGAQLQRILANRSASQSKLDKQAAAMRVMELRSPADGTFVYSRMPWGQKLSTGHRIYPGRPVGLLPVRGKVGARVYVPEVDAVGIAPGQAVALRLDSDAEREHPGRVASVSTVAVPKDRDDPQTYFVVEVAPDAVDAELMRVGSNLAARITTAAVQDALLLPRQAVFYDQDAPFVYVMAGGAPAAREVRLGHASPTLVEVVDGLAAGELVSVAAPDGAAS